jgi:hypothetical protein
VEPGNYFTQKLYSWCDEQSNQLSEISSAIPCYFMPEASHTSLLPSQNPQSSQGWPRPMPLSHSPSHGPQFGQGCSRPWAFSLSPSHSLETVHWCPRPCALHIPLPAFTWILEYLNPLIIFKSARWEGSADSTKESIHQEGIRIRIVLTSWYKNLKIGHEN